MLHSFDVLESILRSHRSLEPVECSTKKEPLKQYRTTENTEKHGKIAKNKTKMRSMKPKYSIIISLGIFKRGET